MMNKLSKDKVYVTISVLILILLTGISYAFFSYYRESTDESQLIAGDIYLHFNEDGDSLLITDAFPETQEEATKRNDNYINFTIDGKNTTNNKDIYYEIILSEGNSIEDKIRFDPSDVKIELIETINGISETVVDGISFVDFDERRIWVSTIERNTQEEVLITYQLRMWISEDVIISDTEDYADYTTEEFQNGFASVRVSVKGDFNYKEASTDTTCFAYQEVAYELNTSNESVNACKDYYLNTVYNGVDQSDANDNYQSFCEGTGTVNNVLITEIFSNLSETVQNDLVALGVFNSNIEITNYDLTCGKDIVIPSTIDEKNVVGIATEKSDTSSTQLSNDSKSVSKINKLKNNTDYYIQKILRAYGVFENYEITSVKFPDSLKYIGNYAFYGCNIKNIVIPATVENIGYDAFSENPLVSIEIKGNPAIMPRAFYVGTENGVSNVFKYGGTCDEFKNKHDTLGVFGTDCQNLIPKQIITSDGVCENMNNYDC